MSNNLPAMMDNHWLSVDTGGVDLDLALVRSFVVTAENLHFGDAAAELGITQQALSKRIRKLEEALGTRLFTRDTRHVTLAPAGHRFLPYARELLAVADNAMHAMHGAAEQVRVDVLDDRLAPMSLVRQVLASHPGLKVEISMRRGLLAALSAMARNEIDVAFGRTRDLGQPLPPHLSQAVVRLEPMHVLLGDTHPLAGRAVLRPAELRDVGLWTPDTGSAHEWDAFLNRFARTFGVPLAFERPAATLEELVERIRREPARVMLTGGDMPLPGAGLRTVRLADPVPVYPWSLVWPSRARRLTEDFVAAVTEVGGVPRGDGGAVAIDPARYWLPEPDLAALRVAAEDAPPR